MAKVHCDQVFDALVFNLVSMCLQTDKTNQRLGKVPHTALLALLMSRNSFPAKNYHQIYAHRTVSTFGTIISVDTTQYISDWTTHFASLSTLRQSGLAVAESHRTLTRTYGSNWTTGNQRNLRKHRNHRTERVNGDWLDGTRPTEMLSLWSIRAREVVLSRW